MCNIMKKLFSILLASALSCSSIFAQDLKAEKRIAELGATENQTWNYLSTITSRFGGRLIGSAAYDDAAQWMLNEFKKLGIEAHLEEAGTVPLGFNRGPWFGKAIGKENFDLHFVTPSYTSGTPGRVKGHVVIEPRNQREFDRIKGKVKGAWVLVGGTSSGWPIFLNEKEDAIRDSIKAINDTVGFRGKLIERPGLYARELLAAGALGFIQSAKLPMTCLYDRPMVNEGTVDMDHLPTHCDIKLEDAQYDKIYNAVEEKQDIELEFDIRNHFRPGPVKWYNVVATIPGTKAPNETIIISGHLDAYDAGTGAVDCGTGLGVVLGAANLIAKSGVKPKRTIKFVAFGGEEFGLLGAFAYCEKHKSELKNIVNIFNRDGGPTACTGISVPEAWYDDIKKITEPMNGLWDFTFQVEKSPARKRVTKPGGQDGTVFMMNGVPAISMMEKDYKGYGFDYREIWHTENDILNKSFQDYMEQASTATAIMTVGIATLDKRLPSDSVYEAE